MPRDTELDYQPDLATPILYEERMCTTESSLNIEWNRGTDQVVLASA